MDWANTASTALGYSANRRTLMAQSRIGGSVTAVALGVGRTTLFKWLREYGLALSGRARTRVHEFTRV